MSKTDKTAEEAFESVNGFDEIAIRKAFGTDLMALREQPTTFLRALVFVEERRANETLGTKQDPQAHEVAMALPLGQLEAYFAAEEDEITPDDPETETGKGD